MRQHGAGRNDVCGCAGTGAGAQRKPRNDGGAMRDGGRAMAGARWRARDGGG